MVDDLPNTGKIAACLNERQTGIQPSMLNHKLSEVVVVSVVHESLRTDFRWRKVQIDTIRSPRSPIQSSETPSPFF